MTDTDTTAMPEQEDLSDKDVLWLLAQYLNRQSSAELWKPLMDAVGELASGGLDATDPEDVVRLALLEYYTFSDPDAPLSEYKARWGKVLDACDAAGIEYDKKYAGR